jgi:peroxiredoxin
MSIDTQSLREQLESMRDQIAQTYPEAWAEMSAFVDTLAQQGFGRRAPQPGDHALDFTLPDMNGNPVTLAEELKRGPVVLAFYRGGWCPFCSLQLQAYQVFLPQIRRLGANVLAVSPQMQGHIAATMQRLSLTFPLLHDQGNAVADQYGLTFQIPERLQPFFRDDNLVVNLPVYNGDESMSLPIPGTFVIDQHGIIQEEFVTPDYTQRLEPARIMAVLRRL